LEDGDLSPAISPHQLAATAEPGQPLRELVGNFRQLEALFEQLGSPAVIELGKPLPNGKYMPRHRAGTCPAAHNRALLGEPSEAQPSDFLPSGRLSRLLP
jgi:hypothetical protein